MASQKQLAANRLNAQKSTGPRSPQGKARSSMNALKTGIDAGTHIIQHESPSRLEALADEYYDRFHPTTPEQRMLVDTLVDSEWLLRRFRRVEAQLWQQGFPNVTDAIFDVNLAVAFRKTCDEFSRLQRRIDMTHRHYRHALQELERLQAQEVEEIGEDAGEIAEEAEETAPAPDPEPEPTSATSHNQSSKPPNGFVPQVTPDTPSDPTPDCTVGKTTWH
jgi:hypothetical protein